jgi:hypothetical protein
MTDAARQMYSMKNPFCAARWRSSAAATKPSMNCPIRDSIVIFPLVKLMAGNQEVDMIGGDHIILYGQPVSLLSSEKPAQLSLAVFGKF